MIRRLFTQFVTDAGDTIDSSQVRSAADVELDQNGFLLKALLTYCEWTGDEDLPRQLWDKIRVTADFPLQEAFFHAESGLLHNSREFWERHAGHGIQDGFELMHQCWTVIGLECAATLASHLGREEEAQRWQQQRELLKRAMLDDSRYALQENGSLIKRRKIDGQVQKDIRVPAGIELPSGVPLLEAGLHYLDPDSSSALPIAWELVEPYSPLAWRTLERLEPLWNQRWDIGGYGRYHVTSEPDSPGPWPFASLFIARAYFEAGDEKRAWRVLRWLNGLPGSRAGSWFEFYGPRPMPPYPQVGIVPWTWAEIIFFSSTTFWESGRCWMDSGCGRAG